MQRWFRFEDWVVDGLPPQAADRARGAARFSAGLAPWGLVFAGAFLALGQWLCALSLLAAALGVGFTPFLIRVTRSVGAGGHWLTAFLFQSLLATAWVTEGVRSTALEWTVGCIAAATLISGVRAGVVWTGIAVVAVWAVYVAQITVGLPTPPPDAQLYPLAAATHTGLFVVAAVGAGAFVVVTERSYHNLELAKIRAEEANRAKSEFLSRMSHELRTPLNAIIGYAELLAEEADAGQAGDLGRIGGAGRQLLHLVNEVLDLAKIEAGHLELAPEAVELGPLFDGVAQQLQPLVDAKRNTLTVEAPRALVAWADPTRLRQCLLNLVGNATKFTADGQIRLVAAAATGGVVIEVHDTGLGMTEEQLAGLFQPFVQASPEVARTHGGTGLGLAIVRQIVERHGGRVWARSAARVGSVFSLFLPSRS